MFGLTITSSWGNGHATLWRGLCKALAHRHCRVVFFERDVPYYSGARDLYEIPNGKIILYPDWEQVAQRAAEELRDCDVAIVTSYCPDSLKATELVRASGRALRVFYDLDTPVTLAAIEAGRGVPYIGPEGLRGFDLVLSFTGGRALPALQRHLAARLVLPLYGHVDPDVHRPVAPLPHYRSSLNYLGTYSADRQATLQDLLIAAARQRPDCRFLIGGAQYPDDFPWAFNIYFVRHLPPAEHPAFFSSSPLTLNLTRSVMAQMGWCPSGRLFEATACGATVLTDRWEGLETFFTPGAEVLPVSSVGDVIAAIDADDAEIARIGRAGRQRTLDEHTSYCRARELISAFETARTPQMAEA